MSAVAERALELAERAWRAAEADEADAVVQVEASGFARFAASEVHQPTFPSRTTRRVMVSSLISVG